MKQTYTFKKWSILLLLFIIGFSQVFAQARYKHVPRVKVDKIHTIEKHIIKNKVTIPLEMPVVVVEEKIIQPETEAVTSTSSSIQITVEKKANVLQLPVIQKKQQVNKDAFTQRVQQKGHLLQVKDVKKTAIVGFLIWFIIVLLVGAAIFVLAFVFLGVVSYSLFYVLLVFGIVGLTIALFILIFGLAGIL